MKPQGRAGQGPMPADVDKVADPLPFSVDLALTGSLCLLVLVATIGFARVYSGTSWTVPVMASVIAASLAAFSARRAGLGPLLVAACALLAIWVCSSELILGGSTQVGLPLLGTLRAASLASHQSAAAFMTTAAPGHAAPGFVLWTAWGAGAAVAASDFLAVRLRSIAAVIPPLLVFVATCVLGAPSGRAWALATFIAATLVFVLVHEWALGAPAVPAALRAAPPPGTASAGAGHVVSKRSRRGGPFTSSGTVLAGFAVLAGVVLVPALGKEGSGTAHWRQDFDVATRVAPDPLVSLQADLLQGAHTPVFVVRSTVAAYWRLTSLQDFDGTTWTGSGSFWQVREQLPGRQTSVGTRQVDEAFDIEELGSPWLPVAFRPETVSAGAAASYDPSSGSLLTRGQTADGERYKIVAAEPLAALSPGVLASVRPITAEERSTLAQFLQLPKGIPARMTQLAHSVMPAPAGEYEKALALQDFFRRPPFVYSLRSPGGTSTGSLVSFLFRTHAGYCQQYATAFVVLARLAGLPSRVAVGFVTGTPIGPHTWQVVGGDAHAWPEVWFPGGVGWVSFEPTPTFSLPGTRQYAAPPSQVQPGPDGATANAVAVAGSLVSPTGGVRGVAGLARSRPGRRRGAAAWPLGALPLAFIALIVGLAAWAGLVRAGQLARWRRRRRRLIRGSPITHFPFSLGRVAAWLGRRPGMVPVADRDDLSRWLLLAWEELCEELGFSGLPRRPNETPLEWARRAGGELRDRGTLSSQEEVALVEIGAGVSHVAYGRWAPSKTELTLLETEAHQIGRRARASQRWRQRLLRYLDPRMTWRPWATSSSSAKG